MQITINNWDVPGMAWPILITVCLLIWCFTRKEWNEGGMGGGIAGLFYLIPTLGGSLVVWIVYAVFK